MSVNQGGMETGNGSAPTELVIYEAPEFLAWIGIFEAIFRRGQVGSFEGIRFVIHTAESGHNKPHLHASYQGKEAVIEIPSGNIISGNLPLKKLKDASKWVMENDEFLASKWNSLTTTGIEVKF